MLLSKVLSSRAFGSVISRHLLNKSGPDQVRILAKQATDQKFPLVHYPICRYPYEKVTDAMAKTATDAVQTGLTLSYKEGEEVLGVMDYYKAYSSGKVTPTEMMHRVFEGIDKLSFMNMFVAVHRENVLEQAKTSDERWKGKKPLSVFDGVPISVKDMVSVKGYQNGSGMVLRESDPISKEDDIMIRRFREAGAIILGITTMTEYGRCPLGYNSHYKGPYNPYDETRYSGGSSSGSVVSVMTGLVPIGISFDGGGSIRLPAALSGAFGLAPTYGRIPCDSVVFQTSGNIHAGVNTATSTDTALAYALLAQNEPEHPLTKLHGLDNAPRPHLAEFDKVDNFAGLRIGIFWDYFNDSDPEVAAYCKAVANELQKRGATIVEVSIPHLKELSLAHSLAISVDFSSLHQDEFYHRDDLEPATKIQLAIGNTVTGAELAACKRLRGWAMSYIKQLFAEKMDVFLTPGCPITAPKLEKGVLRYGESNIPLMKAVMRYIFLVNFAGFPGMVMPIAYSSQGEGGIGLPISCQMIADHWNDALLLRLSHFVEKHIFHRRLPKHHHKLSLD